MSGIFRASFKIVKAATSGRDAHQLTFLISAATGTLTYPKFTAWAQQQAENLAAVCLSNVNFLRCTASEIGTDNKVLKYTAMVVGLDAVGQFPIPAGDGNARDEVVLALFKTSANGLSGTSFLRHCLTANEEADYNISKMIPARFGAINTTGPGDGLNLGAAMMAVNVAQGVNMELPPYRALLSTTRRVITGIVPQDFRLNSTTKRRTSATEDTASGAQKALNELAKQANDILVQAGGTALSGVLLSAMTSLIAEAATIFGALTIAQRAKVLLPAILKALPAP